MGLDVPRAMAHRQLQDLGLGSRTVQPCLVSRTLGSPALLKPGGTCLEVLAQPPGHQPQMCSRAGVEVTLGARPLPPKEEYQWSGGGERDVEPKNWRETETKEWG